MENIFIYPKAEDKGAGFNRLGLAKSEEMG